MLGIKPFFYYLSDILFSETQARLALLENEKKALESDVNLKTEVVVQTSEEARELRTKLGECTMY